MEDVVQPEVQWRVRPATHHPIKALCTWLVILVIGIMIITTDPIIGSVLLLLFIGSLSTFLFPSTFTIDEVGVLANYPIRKKHYMWEQVRRVKFFNDACFLFTRKKPSTLDRWSVMAIYYGNCKNEIVASINSHLREDVAT